MRRGDNSDEEAGVSTESVLLPLAMTVFAEIDSDKSGDLDRDEVRQLFNKVLHEEVEDDDFKSDRINCISLYNRTPNKFLDRIKFRHMK